MGQQCVAMFPHKANPIIHAQAEPTSHLFTHKVAFLANQDHIATKMQWAASQTIIICAPLVKNVEVVQLTTTLHPRAKTIIIQSSARHTACIVKMGCNQVIQQSAPRVKLVHSATTKTMLLIMAKQRKFA